jgi:hypothetical protein
MTRHYKHLTLLNDAPDVFVQAQTTRFGLTRQTVTAESSMLAENTPSDNDDPPVIELDEDPDKLQPFFRILGDNECAASNGLGLTYNYLIDHYLGFYALLALASVSVN